MNEHTLDRTDESDLAWGSAAVNIRRYLDAHRSDPKSATSVVASLEFVGMDLKEHEFESNELAAPEVRLAVDTLRHHIGPRVP